MKLINPCKDDLSSVVDILYDSFLCTELYEGLLPNLEKRKSFVRSFFSFRTKYALNYGEIYCSENFKSVAMWIPPKQHMKFYHLIRFGGFVAMLKAGSTVTRKLIDFEKIMSQCEYEIIQIPHWHLSPIAVTSSEQGKGYGRALLDFKLKQLDKAGESCYLETQSLDNVELYKHFGFKLKKTIKLELGNLNNYAMLREPR